MKYYIVTFDREPNRTYGAFHDDFVKHPGFRHWWHYIKSSYIIGTDLDSKAISNYFTAVAEKHKFPVTHLVLQVELSSRYGRLVKEAWEWIKQNTRI